MKNYFLTNLTVNIFFYKIKINCLKKTFLGDYESGALVTPEDTVLNLIKIINENTFESGSSLRYAE
jgi:hypothetical protein